MTKVLLTEYLPAHLFRHITRSVLILLYREWLIGFVLTERGGRAIIWVERAANSRVGRALWTCPLRRNAAREIDFSPPGAKAQADDRSNRTIVPSNGEVL